MSRRSKKKAPGARSSETVSPAGERPVAADSRWPQAASRPAGWPDRWAVPGVCLLLAAITFAVFGQTVHHEFVNYDDRLYAYENAQVARGLTLNGIAQAFLHGSYDNWDPLTATSHMLDCQLYGSNPGGHHLTNVLLHTAAAILLFLVLRRMTGFLWRSAFVAAVFAIHPLRVESVAWVSERKDVLSGVFFMLTLWAYVRYAQRHSRAEPSSLRFAAPGSRESGTGIDSLALDPRLWTLDYGLVLLCFALGLMSKPMLVTLPCVLLLLDYWPLKRFTQPGGRLVPWRLLVEKVPLLALSGAACVATLSAEKVALRSFEQISFPLRVGNALISYVTYVGQTFWPSGLAVLYPFAARDVVVSSVALSLAVLVGISTGVYVVRRQRPYLLTGWLWYLIMLTPVIGIIQVGSQARADRHTYLPQIGLCLLLTWAAAELCASWRQRRVALGGGAVIILMALIFCARVQTAYWRNSELLWTHALACTSGNWVAHDSLGIALFQKGNVDEAVAHLQKALEIKPDYALAHNNLGNALLEKGKVDEAIVHYQMALEIEPDYADAHYNLGNALVQKGNADEAIVHFQKALQTYPDSAEVHHNLGNALLKNGNWVEAIAQFEKALQINPDYAEARNDLAWVLATCPEASLRNGNQAVALAQRANQLTGDGNPAFLGTLATAYAEAGRF
ncbi:MAG: tetratricopeptide repeat protein, partial [Verrucomicrobiota bacterium]